VIQGTREWRHYRVEAEVTVHMAEAAGIAAGVRGMRRYVALLACRDGSLRLVRARYGDTLLASARLGLAFGETHRLALELAGRQIKGFCDGRAVLESTDPELEGGAVALVCEEGRMGAGSVTVEPC
jgi:hypothetical protein